ncbi:MAG: EAL domain-containing protein [Gammaproteobacteria bacterium]|nr:EAL domain-containing protein [Gammaproteobacteria bacterium]
MLIKNKRILLIDDEQFFRDSIRFFLEDCDYHISEAENGRIGIEMIQEQKPDLVLMDLYMPEMTGLDVLKWAQENNIETPIIIISGAGVIHDVAEALRQGAWDYIFKPIEDLSVLEYAVNKALERVELINNNRNYQLHLEDEVEKRTLALKEVNADLLQKQHRIERSNLEEHVLGLLLKLSLQSRDENEFLFQALKSIVKNLSWNDEIIEGSLFIRSDEICTTEPTMQLVDHMQLSDEHYQQCTDTVFCQTLFRQYEHKKDKPKQDFCIVPVFLKESIHAIFIFFHPENFPEDENEKKFMSKISDILTMGFEKFDAEKEIQFLAYHDALTGLPNRSMLLNRLEQDMAIAERYGWHGALIFVDLDRFKYLNDALGHIIGDELLKQVADRLLGLMRSEDMIARLGGDEFVILLLDQQDSVDLCIYHAQTTAKKIGEILSKSYVLQQHDYYMTASIGISLFPIQGESSTDILKHADAAMYRAKAEGGNTSQFYKSDMQKAADERLSIEKDMRVALINDEMMLYYQPQVMIKDDRIIGAEALLRWQHPERGWVSPADFIPVAEETGIILDIGEWVLKTAVLQIKQWHEQGLLKDSDQIAVNVSPLQFRQTNFVVLVKNAISENQLLPSLLKIELTEGAVIDNINDIIAKMKQLKALGIGFSLDDFGTGYSSLSYLSLLPIDQLKIDRSFVKDITTDQNDVAIIETIIAMGNHLGLDVIAEGVESKSEIELLKDRGCLSYQGYFFSKAISAVEFEQILRKRHSLDG